MRRSPITSLIIACAAATALLAACSGDGGAETAANAPASPSPAAATTAPTVAPAATAAATISEVTDACAPAQAGELHDVTRTPASPYFVHHPDLGGADVPTVVFLSGGRGTRRGAQRAWEDVLSNSEQAGAFRVVLPYSVDIDFIDDARRTFAILDEVLACYGGDPAKVHLGGTSNGGHAAFGLMMIRPELFATLLGAPGAFATADPASVDLAIWTAALTGRAVFNGVGELDDDWKPDVRATHEALVAAGIGSVYVEFQGAGHRLSDEIDANLFYDFWSVH